MFAIDPTTGKQTGYTIPFSARGAASGPDGAIWFTSAQDNGLLGRITTTGAVTTYAVLRGSFPAFSGAPQDITVGGDGDIWYIQDLGVSSLLGHIDPVTKRSWLITPPPGFGGRISSIAAAPGRQLWMSAGDVIYAYQVP
jgi:streptogramin lyase